MALIVAPAVISAGRPWIWILDRSCSCTAVRYLRLVGLIGTLVRLGGSSRRLVHSLLGPGPVTGTSGVMHRPPVGHYSITASSRSRPQSTSCTTSVSRAALRAGPSSLFSSPHVFPSRQIDLAQA